MCDVAAHPRLQTANARTANQLLTGSPGANAPKAYNALFTLWKDADAGVPILSQATTDTLRN